MMRTGTSMAPPGAESVMKRTGRLGYSCALAAGSNPLSAASNDKRAIAVSHRDPCIESPHQFEQNASAWRILHSSATRWDHSNLCCGTGAAVRPRVLNAAQPVPAGRLTIAALQEPGRFAPPGRLYVRAIGLENAMRLAMPVDSKDHRSAEASRRLAIGFLNWAHALDHFVILIYPTVVIELAAVYGQSYATLIALSTASFVAFGLFSLPAGWLGDRWSRRDLMVAFYLGCGVSLIAAAFSPTLYVLGGALFALGMFASIYHPVGTAVVLDNATQRGRNMAFNGVCGNMGVALAAGITAALTAAISWRGAFLVPGIVCLVTGAVYFWIGPKDVHHAGKRTASADVTLSATAAAMIFGLFVVVAL